LKWWIAVMTERHLKMKAALRPSIWLPSFWDIKLVFSENISSRTFEARIIGDKHSDFLRFAINPYRVGKNYTPGYV
jgi:hypothetical protein